MSWEIGYLWSDDGQTPIIWRGTATTTSGVATFYPTDDGTSEGDALFSVIEFYQATARLNTAAAIECPMAAIKEISGDLKTVTVNVIKGINLAVVGDTVEFVPNGTEVSLYLDGHQQ